MQRMNRLNWRIVVAGLCIGAFAPAGHADLDTPADATAPAPIATKPVKKHPKKHSKTVKPKADSAEEAPKVMSLSNDDLPKRHNYYATNAADAQSAPVPVPVPNTNQQAVRAAPSTPTPPAAASTDPYAGVAPRIAPSSDPSAVPTPDASAVHSTTDLNKPIPLNKNSDF